MTPLGSLPLIGDEPTISNERYMAAINALSSAESVEVLRRRLIRHLSIKTASYHHIPAVGSYNFERLNRYFAYNVPPEVAEYFDSDAPQNDPGMHFVFSQARAMWLSELANTEEFAMQKHKIRLQNALEFIGDCLAIPLFGPFHRRGYFVLCFDKPREFFDDIFQWQVQSILQALHLRYCLVVENIRVSARLTTRESEVLELITFGKTNPEIATILGISPNTVTGYVKKIFIKLDVQDRVTAALRASSFSLVT